MVHKGDLLKKAIKESNKKIVDIAKHLGVHRTTINNYFETANLPYEVMLRIGKYIHHDFSKDFAYSTEFQQAQQVQEAQEQYNKPIDFKEKYYNLLEEQNELLRKGSGSYEKLTEAIIKLANTWKSSVNDLGDDLKVTFINNNRYLNESLSVIARHLDKD